MRLLDQPDHDQAGHGPVLWHVALAGDVARFGEVLSGQADAGTWAMRTEGILPTVT